MVKDTNRLGMEKLNNQNCLMKIIKYKNYNDIVVEFQDEYKGKTHTTYGSYLSGGVKNPYHPITYNVGMIGTKYPSKENGKDTKEYKTWTDMLRRCYDLKYKENHPTYQNVTCCKEWLLFENFYEWLHNQENFEKWYNGDKWMVDKDILIKRNKIYSPETCCLVPHNVNKLFIKRDTVRGKYPIGVTKNAKGYQAECSNQLTNKRECLGTYATSERAFKAYKVYKENLIKQVAEIEYVKGNIIKHCYEAMISYEVEITD